MYTNTQTNIKKHTNLKVPSSSMLNLDVSVDKLEVLTQTHLHTRTHNRAGLDPYSADVTHG